MLAAISHADTSAALLCERAFLRMLDGDCRTPLAGHARIAKGRIQFDGLVLTPDGSVSHAVYKIKGRWRRPRKSAFARPPASATLQVPISSSPGLIG